MTNLLLYQRIAQQLADDIRRGVYQPGERVPSVRKLSSQLNVSHATVLQAYASLVERMLAPLPQQVYVSVDIDGLDPALCPHTGTPVPGGLTFPELCTLLRLLVRSGRRVVGFDLTEVAPGPEGDEWDANVGARVLYKLAGWALKSR